MARPFAYAGMDDDVPSPWTQACLYRLSLYSKPAGLFCKLATRFSLANAHHSFALEDDDTTGGIPACCYPQHAPRNSS